MKTAEEVLNKHHIFMGIGDYAPKEFKEAIFKAMEEYAAQYTECPGCGNLLLSYCEKCQRMLES